MEAPQHLVLYAIFLPLWLVLYYVVPYLTVYKQIRCIPGPFIAKFSNLWIAFYARKGKRFVAVDEAHKKYGKIVRVGYNHISIADERALQTVYAHGNGFLKDHFYEAFVSGVPAVFNTRDRAEHTRKRKIIAHAFSPGAVSAFEPYMAENLERWVHQLDRISAQPNENGHAKIDLMPWCTYVAFDIIGDLAFGAPFGMVDKGKDECEAQLSRDGPVILTPGAETLKRRGEVSTTLGLMLPLKPFARYLPDPFFWKGIQSIENLHGIAEMSVLKRLDATEKGIGKTHQRSDILDMLIHSKGPDSNPMSYDELVSESLTQIIAGSDTVSNTSCVVAYWILHGERESPGTILPCLRNELDQSIPAEQDIATHAQVKNLPFLRRCIDEAMRLHSTSASGLPRIVTADAGVNFDGTHFPDGTVLSVPSYTIHHDPEIWGPDVETFNPDRWLPGKLTPRQRTAFNPFSLGPRACVGQNVAMMEMCLILGTLFRRYDLLLYQRELQYSEGMSKKPVDCWIGIKRRDI